MKTQLTYVLITPYTLKKSRTGGIIGRILALSRGVRFVGARMYAPSDEMVDRYLETLAAEDLSPTVRAALEQYVRREPPPRQPVRHQQPHGACCSSRARTPSARCARTSSAISRRT